MSMAGIELPQQLANHGDLVFLHEVEQRLTSGCGRRATGGRQALGAPTPADRH
jgi:hypothetical protein